MLTFENENPDDRRILLGYKAVVRTPANVNYRGYKVTSTVAPSSGTVVLSALNILNGYKTESVPDPTQPGGKRDSNTTAQIIVETMKVRRFIDSHPLIISSGYKKADNLQKSSGNTFCIQFAYGQRTVLGDPTFVKNVTELELAFLAPKVGAEIRAKLPLNHTGPDSVSHPTPSKDHTPIVHLFTSFRPPGPFPPPFFSLSDIRPERI